MLRVGASCNVNSIRPSAPENTVAPGVIAASGRRSAISSAQICLTSPLSRFTLTGSKPSAANTGMQATTNTTNSFGLHMKRIEWSVIK